jgi:hypothetical protein
MYRRKNDPRARRYRLFVRMLSATPRFTPACRGRRSAIQRGPKRQVLEPVFRRIMPVGAISAFAGKQGHKILRMRHKKISKRSKRRRKWPPMSVTLQEALPGQMSGIFWNKRQQDAPKKLRIVQYRDSAGPLRVPAESDLMPGGPCSDGRVGTGGV